MTCCTPSFPFPMTGSCECAGHTAPMGSQLAKWEVHFAAIMRASAVVYICTVCCVCVWVEMWTCVRVSVSELNYIYTWRLVAWWESVKRWEQSGCSPTLRRKKPLEHWRFYSYMRNKWSIWRVGERECQREEDTKGHAKRNLQRFAKSYDLCFLLLCIYIHITVKLQWWLKNCVKCTQMRV